MLLSSLLFLVFLTIFGSVHCTSDVSNPTPVYVVQGREVVLQCEYDSSRMRWHVYNGGSWNSIADGGDTINDSKYSTSKNTSTGLYYRLHILNVGVSDVKKYRCEAVINGNIQSFYLQLILIEPQESSALIGGVIGGVVGVIIIVMIIVWILFFMKKKGLSNGRDKTKSNRNKVAAADNSITNDTYENIEGATSNQRKKESEDK